VKNIYAKEILSIYLVKPDSDDNSDEECDIAIKLKNNFSFDPLKLAILLSGVLDYCINLVPESIQNEFEEEVLKILPEVLEIRHEHTDTLTKDFYDK
jgi:hypothetical protein